jgi:hypothetical protein
LMTDAGHRLKNFDAVPGGLRSTSRGISKH